jgi:hypothetical protein
VPWRVFCLFGFDIERVVGREFVDSLCLSCLDACLVAARWALCRWRRHCGCELGKFRAMRRRLGLEVPGDGAELARLELMQAGVEM